MAVRPRNHNLSPNNNVTYSRLPPRNLRATRSIERISYRNVSGWLAGWLAGWVAGCPSQRFSTLMADISETVRDKTIVTMERYRKSWVLDLDL